MKSWEAPLQNYSNYLFPVKIQKSQTCTPGQCFDKLLRYEIVLENTEIDLLHVFTWGADSALPPLTANPIFSIILVMVATS